MTIFLSNHAKGLIAVGRPQTAYAVHQTLFSLDLPANVATTDKIALGVLPAFCAISDALLFSEGALGAATANVGFMTGAVDSADDARLSGSELYSAIALNAAFARLTKGDALLVPSSDADRAIGLSGFSAALTGGAGKRVHLLLSFRAT